MNLLLRKPIALHIAVLSSSVSIDIGAPYSCCCGCCCSPRSNISIWTSIHRPLHMCVNHQYVQIGESMILCCADSCETRMNIHRLWPIRSKCLGLRFSTLFDEQQLTHWPASKRLRAGTFELVHLSCSLLEFLAHRSR